jgi:hypothetical protein
MPIAVPKKKAPEKLSTITNRLDRLTSILVRKRDKRCCTCGSTENLQCGHFISRVFVNTRWDLRNCNAQCASCNVMHELNPVPYYEFMLAYYGKIVIVDLNQEAHSGKKLNRGERAAIEALLKQSLERMNEQ